MATEGPRDRVTLCFIAEVEAAFSFLKAEGFQRLCIERTAVISVVQYRSSKLDISVFYETYSYEIGLDIRPRPPDGRRHSFSSVLALIDPEQAAHYRDYAACTEQGVVEGVRRLAELMQRCVGAGVLDDSQLFPRLERLEAENARRVAIEVELSRARSKCDAAWQRRDYAAVVGALHPVRALLTEAEVRKLEYSEKQMQRPDGRD